MARIRTIKPGFFRDEELQDLEAGNPGCYCMLVFAGLWGQCDKLGRFEWKPRSLKLDILPFLTFDMAATLGLLESAGFVSRYSVDGKEYGEVVTFEKHQRISGKEAQEPAAYPSPPSNRQGSTREATEKHSRLQEGNGVQEGEEEGNGESVRDADQSPSAPGGDTKPIPTEHANRASRLPADWKLPKAWGEWAMAEQPTWTHDHVRRVAEQFRDYWCAKGGKDARKTDWLATWRNWIRREPALTDIRGSPGGRQQALEERNRKVAANWVPPEMRNGEIVTGDGMTIDASN